jgi:hypothetical protein
MKAIMSARSWASSTMLGMERCDVSSATLSAIADMPLTLAMALRVDEPKPNWVRFVDCQLEAGAPKRNAPALAFSVAGALAAALQDLSRSHRRIAC